MHLYVLILLFLLSTVSLGASNEPDYASHITTDLGMEVNIEPLHAPINATYKLIDDHDGVISWSFNKEAKSDTGFIYSDGRILVGSLDMFAPSVKDRLDNELLDAINLVNSTEKLTVDQNRWRTGVVYYSGGEKVTALTWNRCGNILVESGRYGPALFYYDKSREADPTFVDPWNNEGVALRNLGRYQNAVTFYDEALKLSPNNSVILNNRGESQYRIKRQPPSLEDFNRSCRSDPGNSPAWYNKGVELYGLGWYIEAADCDSRSLEADSYNANAWNNKGAALAMQGLYQDALPCFSNAATINPKLAGAWANGGIVLQNLGFEGKSKDAFSRAKTLGYNQTKDYYVASTLPPAILSENGEKMPGLSLATSMILIYLIYLGRRPPMHKRGDAFHF
jgi:tetratricopeptide (TPR) repeat protein